MQTTAYSGGGDRYNLHLQLSKAERSSLPLSKGSLQNPVIEPRAVLGFPTN